METLKLTPFTEKEFVHLIEWIDSPELLATIAGNKFSFPLTHEQLQNYVDEPNSCSFNVIFNHENEVIGHAEIITLDNKRGKLDKLIIGNKTQRGKGIGEKLMNALLDFVFNELSMDEVELYVYDWNIGGIKCYEKVGFIFQEENTILTKFHDNLWTALQMTISRTNWNEKASCQHRV